MPKACHHRHCLCLSSNKIYLATTSMLFELVWSVRKQWTNSWNETCMPVYCTYAGRTSCSFILWTPVCSHSDTIILIRSVSHSPQPPTVKMKCFVVLVAVLSCALALDIVKTGRLSPLKPVAKLTVSHEQNQALRKRSSYIYFQFQKGRTED